MLRPLLYCLLLLCGLRFASADEARLRDGDIFRLAIAGPPRESTVDFELDYTVDRGMVRFPVIGPIRAAELTQTQLAAEIERRFKDGKIFTQPGVTIRLLRAQQGLVVAGEVLKPGRYPWLAGMTLTQAIGSAGGATSLDFGTDKVRVIRKGKTTVFSLKAIRKDPKLDPTLLMDDIVEVGNGDL